MNATETLTDAELNAYLDDELAGDERQSVESRLAKDPGAAKKMAELGRLDDAIRARYGPILNEPLPAPMQSVLTNAPMATGMPLWARVAAALVLLLAGAAAGYTLRGQVEVWRMASAELVQQAVNAHSVYSSEVRHPVEVNASEEAHLVKWLTKRLGANVRAPSLSGRGFVLLGGRLLPNTRGPAAQFMYENAEGRRLTLYLRQAGSSENTAFQFAAERGLSAFYWIDKPLAYALVGEMPRQDLLEIARFTYEQLN